MSNHDGGYLLNYALTKLNEAGAFASLNSNKTYQLIVDIVQFATHKYDCNEGEILEGLSAVFGVCAYCLQHKKIVFEDYCAKCCKELGYTKEDIADWQRKNT